MHLRLPMTAVAALFTFACNKMPDQAQAQPAVQDQTAGPSDETVVAAAAKSVATRQAPDDNFEKANPMTGKISKDATHDSVETQTSARETPPTTKDMVQARNELRAWSQRQIDHIDNAISDARAKSASATTPQKHEFERAMRDVQARRAMVNREISRLASQSEGGLSRFEARLHTDMNDLTERVDKMRSAL